MRANRDGILSTARDSSGVGGRPPASHSRIRSNHGRAAGAR